MPVRFALRILAPALALLLGACGDSTSSLAPSELSRASSPSATLLECPTDATASASETIDLLGGTLQVVDAAGGLHEVVFPQNAVALPTTFTLTVPAGQYVKVDVTAVDALTGEPQSITFPADAQPTLAISYKRCTRSNTDNTALHLYNIDPGTSAVLEGPFGGKEGGTDPRVKGAVPHFSEYAIGTP